MWPTTCNNNRPVSLLPAVSKICERVASTQLTSYLKNKKTPHWATKREQEVTFSWDTERQKELSPVPSGKDHGVQVDDTLSYDEHITNTVSARIARLCLINRVNYIFDTQTLLNIIKALVCSKLYYNCSSVWGGGDSHIKRAGMLVGKFQMNP